MILSPADLYNFAKTVKGITSLFISSKEISNIQQKLEKICETVNAVTGTHENHRYGSVSKAMLCIS
jgi:hypothetical protein